MLENDAVGSLLAVLEFHGRTPFRFDAASFPAVVAVPDGDRIPLVVLTYTSGIGTSPTGIGTSPTVPNRPGFRAYFLSWEGWHVYAGQV